MGNRFVISVLHDQADEADFILKSAFEEVERIEQLLSTYRPHSIVNQINAAAGSHAVEVPLEVFDLVERAQRVSRLSGGVFDLTYGGIDSKLWNFDQNMASLPSPEVAKKGIGLINYKKINLNRSRLSVGLDQEGMRIGFGGIGKGYAADCVRNLLKKRGIQGGIVNAAGDLCTWGQSPTGGQWVIQLAHPDYRFKAFSELNISNLSVATSGNYEKFVTIGNKRYSHTIDPRTGFPAEGIKSATVISPFAEFSDAMATPLMVLGVKNGLDLINQIKGVECVIIDDKNQVFISEGIKSNI